LAGLTLVKGEFPGFFGTPSNQRSSALHRYCAPRHLDNAETRSDIEVVRASAFFGSLSGAQLDNILGLCRPRVVARGQTLFFQGDEAKCFYLVLEGWLKVVKVTPGGEAVIRRVVQGGETMAEAPAFSDGVYPGNAEAITPARVLEVPMSGFVAALGGRESLAYAMVLGMARQAESTASALECAYRYSAPQRLAAHLMKLFPQRAGHMEGLLPYDKSLLAHLLGMTPETLSRALAALRPFGVSSQGRQIIVDRVQVLRDYCRIDD